MYQRACLSFPHIQGWSIYRWLNARLSTGVTAALHWAIDTVSSSSVACQPSKTIRQKSQNVNLYIIMRFFITCRIFKYVCNSAKFHFADVIFQNGRRNRARSFDNCVSWDMSLKYHPSLVVSVCIAMLHWNNTITKALTHWGRDKMAAIFQTTFSNAFSLTKIYEIRIKFHWSLFPRV